MDGIEPYVQCKETVHFHDISIQALSITHDSCPRLYGLWVPQNEKERKVSNILA